MSHDYKENTRGRSFLIEKDTRHKFAQVHCSLPDCGHVGQMHMSGSLMPPEVIDKKFKQKGWSLDPHVCPECVARKAEARKKVYAKTAELALPPVGKALNRQQARAVVSVLNRAVKHEAKEEMKEQKMTTRTINEQLKPLSGDAHKATAIMHRLLSTHFDPDEGKYDKDWTDKRVADEANLAEKYVSEVREIAYGPIKEPEALTSVRSDIKALHDLINDTLITAQKEVNQLNARVNAIAKELGFKPAGK